VGAGYPLAEARKLTPRQIHAALHHAQSRRKNDLADMALIFFAGTRYAKKDIERFTQDLTRDAQ
jgi:hypothetical protein